MARHGSLDPAFEGSNPSSPASFFIFQTSAPLDSSGHFGFYNLHFSLRKPLAFAHHINHVKRRAGLQILHVS